MTDLRKAAEMALVALDHTARSAVEQYVIEQQVVTFLKQALAQPEPWDTSDMAYRPNGLSVEQSIAQPEQEPVDIHCPSCLHSFSIVPVAKRQWVSLTDEEIDYIWGVTPPDYENFFGFPRAIEAKLKEKNT